MRIWPVFVDSAPAFAGAAGEISLLSMPLGLTTVFAHLQATAANATPNAPVVLSPAGAGPEYARRMSETCPDARVVSTAHELHDVLAGYEISDVLLVMDPRCLAARDREIASLIEHFSGEQQVVHHLVAFESGVAGTKEQVNLDAAGRVRSIHRFYEPATWPFVSGVAASLVPMSSAPFGDGQMASSLGELRQQLMSRGVSSRDLPIERGAFHLDREQGLLAASEQFLIDEASGGDADLVGGEQSVHVTARIIGPVAIHEHAVVEEDVTLVGPALIGPGARVKAGALIAHALIGPGSVVPAGAVVRDRVWFGDTPRVEADADVTAELSFGERLARVSAETQDRDIQAPGDANTSLELRAKRAFDFVVSLISLIVLSPVLGLLAAVVKIESRGPVFYGGEREGLGGRLFSCWKFRTMRTDAHAVQHNLKGIDKMDGPHFKLDRDPRVTRIGRILRAANLDELPQLFNVLRGDMSLVGPRPSPFRENQICVPWREARLSVRPGMTGLWQVCRQDRASGDFHQWIEYDLLYVQHIGLLLDLKILVATFLTLGGKVSVPSAWMVRTDVTKPDLWIDRHAATGRGAVRGTVARTISADAARSRIASDRGASDYEATVRSA